MRHSSLSILLGAALTLAGAWPAAAQNSNNFSPGGIPLQQAGGGPGGPGTAGQGWTAGQGQGGGSGTTNPNAAAATGATGGTATPNLPLFDQRSLADTPGQQRPVERLGMPTQAEAGPTIPPPLGIPTNPATAVFGAALFTGQPQSSSDAPNPNYILAPGDRVSVRAWGAVDSEIIGQIDPAGNLFLPNIGPIRVAGTRVGDLQQQIQGEISKVYTNQVQVYATVLSTQRIGVFVTGFVRSPGRYAGVASDSILDFLMRANGVDPGRGSYREITLLRGGRQIASIDLYGFLLEGRLPILRLQEGDTLVVARQHGLVGADGAVRNNYLFEPGSHGPLTGRELINYARPLPAATNAVVRGVRGAQPFSRYMTIQELAGQQLLDQDTVTFVADVAARTIRVTVEGSRLYPSVLVADRDMPLCQVLDHVAVDPALADTNGVFLLRPSLAAQQQRAINEALDRLERQLFLSTSATPSVSDARTAEANLVSQYIGRARRVQPDGRLVVMSGEGRCSPVRLEDGDIIVIPQRSQTVLVQGEVNAPQPVVWHEGWSATDYVRAAGGLTDRGRESYLMLRRPSGETIYQPSAPPRPGDEVIALPYLDPKIWAIGRDFFTMLYQVALGVRVFQ